MRADQEPAGPAAGPDPAAGGHAKASPDLGEAIEQLSASGRASFQAARDAATALRILVSADISLARSAFGRTLAFTGVAIAFGASAWLLLMASLIAWLSLGLGWAWSLSLLLTAGLSVVVTVIAALVSMRYFEHTRMQATRRQLARLGVGELSGIMPDADSHESSEQAADRVAVDATDGTPIKKGLGVDVTPP